MPGKFELADGTQVRICALAAGSRTPLTGNAMTLMPDGTKADLERGASDKSARTFDSTMAEDGQVITTNWSLKIGGYAKNQSAYLAFYAILKAAWATGAEVYVEKKRTIDTTWSGGACSVMSLPEPTAVDNLLEWSADLKGRGQLLER